MKFWPSPLRYPGGKGRLGQYLAELVELNSISDGTYVEPYAGGAGAAWFLLLKGYVGRVKINDASVSIAAFWRSVFEETDELLRMVSETEITVDEHRKQTAIFRDTENHSIAELGFAAFFLNRTSRSGILNAGPIGGYDQTGNYKIDARYNKEGLQKRIEALALYAARVDVSQKDALEFISQNVVNALKPEKCLIYCDPPYFEKGRKLYLDYYKNSDHRKLAGRLKKLKRFKWLLSYDDTKFTRKLFDGGDYRISNLSISHSANLHRRGKEIIVTPKHLNVPEQQNLRVA